MGNSCRSVERSDVEEVFRQGAVLRPCQLHGKVSGWFKYDNICHISALSDAVYREHLTCVIAFIQAGADVNERMNGGWTCLHAHPFRQGAAQSDDPNHGRGHRAIIRRLIDEGADVNAVSVSSTFEGSTPLARAAYFGHDRCIEMLLEAGADVNLADTAGLTAIVCGTHTGRLEPLTLLVRAGADVNACNELGKDAAKILAENGHPKCLKFLLESGASVNSVEKYGRTALLCAAMANEDKCVEVLLEAGSNVNLTSDYTNTALLLTCANQKAPGGTLCIKKLLKGGAYINQKDKCGNNAIAIYMAFRKLDFVIYKDVVDEGVMYLYAAGETIGGDTVSRIGHQGETLVTTEVPAYIMRLRRASCLKEMCRKVIRDHLVKNNHPRNLFCVVPSVGLPSLLKSYLLFDMSL